MRVAKFILAAVLASASFGQAMGAPNSLEDLLEQTRTIRQKEAQANQEREAKFLAERNKQAAARLLGLKRTTLVAKLRRRSFYHAGDQWMLHFEEKGGKSREAWLEAGMHGEMDYMQRHGRRRSRPAELIPGLMAREAKAEMHGLRPA